jgi:hypothetical protein
VAKQVDVDVGTHTVLVDGMVLVVELVTATVTTVIGIRPFVARVLLATYLVVVVGGRAVKV